MTEGRGEREERGGDAPVSRRAFLIAGAAAAAGGVLLGAPALVGLRRKAGRRLAGGFVDDGGRLGHRLRDGTLAPTSGAARREVRRPIVIVGGGIAGLSAAWRLERCGVHEWTLLELERQPGGNARWGESAAGPHPWAAHYVPVPGPRATLARELFADLGVLRADGTWDERARAFAPQERVWRHGEWHPGVRPEFALSIAEREELHRFDARLAELRATGEFTVPMALGARASALDAMTMAAWLEREGFRTPAVRWWVDYACRDDYGARASAVSAWAGVHYFASREGGEEAPLTWPEGNGWIVRRLLARFGERVETGAPVWRVERHGRGYRVRTVDADYLADAVILAAPPFLASRLMGGSADGPRAEYSPWLTAALVLDRWPAERGAPPAWDNVLHDSPSLGYVVANHQSLATQPVPSVWTYYWALADGPAAEERHRLQRLDWRACAEAILADLERAHPDIRDCVRRVDVLRLGHAMVRPVPGFLGTALARDPRLPRERIVLAHSELSGLSLFEEAQHHGVRAADLVLELLGAGVAGD